eukprot:TRINITY_DN12940_c1_g2_i1.p1 TRINITY_DN12940_c1_g2~~TRINITY_DN12940_c1_g2_i1.p1  ORF type:complete len:429 (+),score=50.76 TRINITY_DN12940_c1_g2_i1:83-1369(+)
MAPCSALLFSDSQSAAELHGLHTRSRLAGNALQTEVLTAPLAAGDRRPPTSWRSFLGNASSFALTTVEFTPKKIEMEAQKMNCEEDMAVCNRECERLYGDQQAELEEPCKLAVVEKFTGVGGGGMSCFPASAIVWERRRGGIPIEDVSCSDELAIGDGCFSPVLGMLHALPEESVLYVRIRYGAVGSLTMTPQHLVRVRRRPRAPRASTTEMAFPMSGDSLASASLESDNGVDAHTSWEWLAASAVLPGDELCDTQGAPVLVREVARLLAEGAYAPLTASGTLLVDGVLCSCYAPPTAWRFSHDVCHAAMAPLRVLDTLRRFVERATLVDGSTNPILTMDALWLLPKYSDPSLHPWASGLLRCTVTARALAQKLRSARTTEKLSQELDTRDCGISALCTPPRDASVSESASAAAQHLPKVTPVSHNSA